MDFLSILDLDFLFLLYMNQPAAQVRLLDLLGIFSVTEERINCLAIDEHDSYSDSIYFNLNHDIFVLITGYKNFHS